jgi:Delta7-sterol 5-desaturase
MVSSMPEPLRVFLVMLLVDASRYVVPATAAFLIFWVWGRERFRRRLIQGAFPRAQRLLRDLRSSAGTVIVFAVFGVGTWYGRRAGVLRTYAAVGDQGAGYFAGSVVALIVLQDTYFYWTHRAMHHPLVYRAFHRVHHVSTNPSPFTAYAFALPEAIVHALFVPAAWLLIPLHQAAVFVFLLFMVARNVLGHLSIELFPRGFTRSRFFGMHTTATHHALHHKDFTSNFGLYFTFWDRLMGTTHPRYDETFERVVSRGGSG